jgi:hypothetical protein
VREPELLTAPELRDPELLRAALPDERLEPELRAGDAELREPELRRTALPEERLEPELRRTALPDERLGPELRVAVRPLLLREGDGRLTDDRLGALR